MIVQPADGTAAITPAAVPAISLEHITRTFPGTRALDDVSLDVRAGEVHCLIGENGAGKSTLMKILAGVERPDQGRIVIRGVAHAALTPRSALEQGIRTIHQDADIVSSLTVADNVFLGQEPMTRGLMVDRAHQRRVCARLVDELGVELDPDRLAGSLSPAQQQLTQVVRALRGDPQVLVLDEPTTSLGHTETEHLLGLVRRLADRGIAIIYISHYLDEVLRLGDRVTVLKDGRHVATLPAAGATPDELARLMVGRSASAFFTRQEVPLGDLALAVEGYRGPGIPDPVSFDVRRGEVLGLGGLVGAGRTELLELLFGVVRPTAGTVAVGGRAPCQPRSPRAAVAAGLSLVTEDRATSGLLPDRSVRENLSVAWNELRGHIVRGERPLATSLVERLGVVTPGVEQEVRRLSGGNQQKVVIGRWLAVDADVYLLDEPTKGVDIGAKHDIYTLIGQLLQAGKGVVLASSDLPELISMSDRIAVMREGRMTGIVPARSATEHSLMLRFLGVAA